MKRSATIRLLVFALVTIAALRSLFFNQSQPQPLRQDFFELDFKPPTPKVNQVPIQNRKFFNAQTAEKLSNLQRNRFFTIKGFKYCTPLAGSVMDALVPIRKIDDYSENALVMAIDSTAQDIYSYILTAFNNVNPTVSSTNLGS
jgi:hypothetical protein